MKVEIRSDAVHISGYVNAVGRDSRLIPDRRGAFVEQVEPGTFRRALSRGKPVELRLNHRRVIGSTADGSLSLYEDAIGLHAEAVVTDPEVMEKARRKELRGWSFGFRAPKDQWQSTDPPRRFLQDLDLTEVSLIDQSMTPAYVGTLVEARADGEEPDALTEFRQMPDEVRVLEPEAEKSPETAPKEDENKPTPPDYRYRRRILNLKRSESK